MSDTIRTRSQLQTALADNRAGAITAQTMRDWLASQYLATETDAAIAAATAPLATTSALTAALASYVTTASLTTTLASYATTSALTSGLATKAAASHTHAISDVTGLSSALATKADATSLSAYATTSALTTTLASYATTSALTSALANYVTTSALTTALGATADVTFNSLTIKTARLSFDSDTSTLSLGSNDEIVRCSFINVGYVTGDGIICPSFYSNTAITIDAGGGVSGAPPTNGSDVTITGGQVALHTFGEQDSNGGNVTIRGGSYNGGSVGANSKDGSVYLAGYAINLKPYDAIYLNGNVALGGNLLKSPGASASISPSLLGTGTASASTYLKGNGTWSGIDGSHISTGTISTARLGSGTASSSTYLRGDNTWAGIDAASLSSGTVSTARLGSGTASSSTYLRGDNTWAAPTSVGAGGTTTLARPTCTLDSWYGLSGNGSTETTLRTITVKAGVLSRSSDGIQLRLLFNFNSNTNAKTIRIYLQTGSDTQQQVFTRSTSAAGNFAIVNLEVFWTASTTAGANVTTFSNNTGFGSQSYQSGYVSGLNWATGDLKIIITGSGPSSTGDLFLISSQALLLSV